MASTDRSQEQIAMKTGKDTKITLYWLEKSRSQRIVWLLEELKVDYEIKTFKRVNKLAPEELKQVHPLGKAPVVTIESSATEKPLVLAESSFIIEYLIDHFGTWLAPERYRKGQDGQVGGETEEWTRYRYFMHYAEGSIMPLLVMALVFNTLKAQAPFFIKPVVLMLTGAVESKFLNPNFKTHFDFLESQIASSANDGKYLCGTELTGADIVMSFPLGAAKGRAGFSKEKHPKLWAYVERIEALDGFKKAVQKIIDREGSYDPSFAGGLQIRQNEGRNASAVIGQYVAHQSNGQTAPSKSPTFALRSTRGTYLDQREITIRLRRKRQPATNSAIDHYLIPETVYSPTTPGPLRVQLSHCYSEAAQSGHCLGMAQYSEMFSVDNNRQNTWLGEDTQGSILFHNDSAQPRSEIDNSTSGTATRKQTPSSSTGKDPMRTPGVLRSGDAALLRNGQPTLPAEKSFAIQIGWKLFRLSGASIMSDAPSYFSTFFEEQMRLTEQGAGELKTLFIDRDPGTFADICRHLQGYWITPRDNSHYVKLYADAQFYSLPRLVSQLFDSEISVSIGGKQFQLPRDTFSGPGNSANFFSLGFGGFLGSRDAPFPGLESRRLMRPPAVQPQSVPMRSPAVFEDLIHIARGYPLTIRDANHRAELLADCKYYGLKGLMHRIFVHKITYNAERGISEILMRLEDLHKSGISFVGDASPSDQSPLGGWVNYSRPFVDETSYEAIVEIGNEETKIDFRSMRADFYGDTKARISSLFQVVADKMNLPSNLPLGLMMSSGGASAAPASPANSPLSEDRVKIRIGPDTHIILDGQEHTLEDSRLDHPHSLDIDIDPSSGSSSTLATPTISTWPNPTARPSSTRPPPTKRRKRKGSLDEFGEWIVKKGQWRMRVQPRADQSPQFWGAEGAGMEIVLCAVKLVAVSGQRGRNMGRDFLS